MIAYLRGTILKKVQKAVILDTGNIGYLVHVPLIVADNLQEKEETELYIFTKVREDDISLYGFENLEQQEFFKTLIAISGVGAKMAIDIMSQNIETVKSAIVSEDAAMLSKIPGIGKKTADRIIVELKNKIDALPLTEGQTTTQSQIDDDAVSALLGLGYQRYEINRVLNKMPSEIKEPEQIVTYFLQNN